MADSDIDIDVDETLTLWTPLANIACGRFSEPFPVNPNEFGVAVESTESIKFHGLMKYDITENKWVEWIKYPDEFWSSYHTMSLNISTNTLYMTNSERELITIDLSTHKFTTIECPEYDEAFASSLCINNAFHVFGGWNHSKHLIWNDDKQRFDEIYEMYASHRYFGNSSLYLKSRNEIYLIGGRSAGWSDVDDIWYCSLLDYKWKKSDIKMAVALMQFAAVITANDQYIIIIKNSIYVLDLQTMIFKTSKISTPTMNASMLRAYIVEDESNKDIVINGYIRNSLLFIDNIDYISEDLINIIASFYSNDWIHLLLFHQDNNHWKIKIDAIIESLD